MKPCPECGEPMRLAAGQWIHATPGRCRTISLRASAEEMRQHGRLGGPLNRAAPSGRIEDRRFRYLTPQQTPLPGGD